MRNERRSHPPHFFSGMRHHHLNLAGIASEDYVKRRGNLYLQAGSELEEDASGMGVQRSSEYRGTCGRRNRR